MLDPAPESRGTVQQQQTAQLDQRAAHLTKLLESCPDSLRRDLEDKMEISWIYHESALEGVVYTPEELRAALRGEAPVDPALVSTFDEIRQNKATIGLVREWARTKQTKVDADVIKDIYLSLAPDEVDGKKPPAYRKDIPLHRLYFHEIAAPDKIIPKLKAFSTWIGDPETRRSMHVLRLAAKAHFHLLHVYPYPKHSGKVARLVMNLLLMSAGYPPAMIHSTERQRYYDALKTNENALAQIVKEALTASVESAIRYLEQKLPAQMPMMAPSKKAKPGQRLAEPRAYRSEAPRPMSQHTTEVLPPRPGSTRAVKPPVREAEPAAQAAPAKEKAATKASEPEVASTKEVGASTKGRSVTERPAPAKAGPSKPPAVAPKSAPSGKSAKEGKAPKAAKEGKSAKEGKAAKAAKEGSAAKPKPAKGKAKARRAA